MSWIDDIQDKVLAQNKKNMAVLAAIPEKYQHYVQMLEKSSRISNKEENLDQALKDLGCNHYKGNTVLWLKIAYLTVMGKVAMLNDWAEIKGYDYIISEARFSQIGGMWSCDKQVTIFNSQGKIVKQATGTSSVGFNNKGVDATNPLENAETSALGRALTFLGFGTQTENVASLEEMNEAAKREAEAEPETEPENDENQKLYVIDELRAFEKDNKPIAKLKLLDQETGEISLVWLQSNQVLQAKHLGLEKGDLIQGVITEIEGKQGSVSTFLDFKKVS